MSKDVTPSTLATHTTRLKTMSSLCRCKENQLFSHALDLIAVLKKSKYKPSSISNLLSTLLVKWPDSKYMREKKLVCAYRLSAIELAAKSFESGKKRGNLISCTVTFRKIRNACKRMMRDPSATSSVRTTGQLIVLGIYAHFAPKRSDWGEIELVRRPSKDSGANYIDLTKNEIVFQKFKTAKRYGKQVESIPIEFRKLLDKTLEKWPRKTLFVKKLRPKSFGDLVRGTMGKHLKCVIGINDLRHIYITEFASKRRCFSERKALAREMHHRVETQLRYEQYK